MFGTSLIRGIFLIFMFPKIISVGREWLNGPSEKTHHASITNGHEDDVPTDPRDFPASPIGEVPQEPIKAPDAENGDGDEDEDVGTAFDLLFVRWSLVMDAIVTMIAGFSSQGWHVYMGQSRPCDLLFFFFTPMKRY
jgi:hypothetical protein